MVFYYVWIVSLLVSFCHLSGAMNNTTTALSTTASLTTTSPTTTETATSQPTATAIIPTTTGAATSQSITVPTSQPSGTTTPTPATAPFTTRMTVTFETENSECNQGIQEKFEEKTWDLYKDGGFNTENVNVLYSNQTGKCVFNITVIFGQNFSRNDVIETFEKAIKQSEFNGVTIKELNISVHVNGVTLDKFSVKEADCKKICCEGGGGEITLTRSCTSNPANKCANFNLTKVEKDCTKVCDKHVHCSGAINNISLMAMLLGAFIHWFLK